MCGIAGMALEGSARPDRRTLERMAERIRHRGPDEDGFLAREGVGFAFRRLRIIDLETGSQPQTNEDGTIHIVFNGEIYNHVELRESLKARGHQFRSSSDTEVVVHLYEEKGPDLVRELNGMFAFAIWDSHKRELVVARDHVGIKPLLYAELPGALVFASEMGCLHEVDEIDLGLDPVAVHQYLSWGAVPAPLTLHRGVKRLPPGHVLRWREGELSIRRYWHPLEKIDSPPESFEKGTQELRNLLEDSVKRQSIADVPLGAFLSGGVDSTTIVGLMANQADDVHTFSIGFSEDPVFDETPYAREAAEFHKTKHQEEQLAEADILDVIPSVLDRVSEPFGSASLLPTYVVSRETRRHMTVALSGDGADELFAGYNKYLGETYRRRWEILPRPMRALLEPSIRQLPASRNNKWGELGRKAHKFLDGVSDDPIERHDRWMRYASANEVSRLLGQAHLTNPGLDVIRGIHRDFETHGGRDGLHRILYTDFNLALPTDMLVKVDLASMLNSLEVRVPFLDHRIVTLANSMPSSWKMKGTDRKRVLKQAAKDLLPPGIQNRPKAGFDVPVGEWLKDSMRDLFWDTISRDGQVSLDTTLLSTWYEEHRSGRIDRSKVLWAAFALRWWEERHAPRTRSPLRETGTVRESATLEAV